MRKSRSSLVSAIAIGLLAGSTVGVAAQAEEVGGEAPVEFSVGLRGNGPNLRPESIRERTASGGARGAGGAWRWSVAEEATDPRFKGTPMVAWNHDEYPGGLRVSHWSIRIEDEVGAWQGTPMHEFHHNDGAGQRLWMALVGEGEYEGFYAVANLSFAAGSATPVLSGLIFEGDPLPEPEPYVSG